MKQLKFLMFILLAAAMLSCNSTNEPESGDNLHWEFVSRLSGITYALTVANNGDVWVSNYYRDLVLYVLYLSTDNGHTWFTKGTFSDSPTAVAISPVNGYIFAGTEHNLFRSTDNGGSWESIAENVNVWDILVMPSGEIYVAAYYSRGVYYSNDNGDTWILKGNGISNANATSLALGVDGTLYAGTSYRGVYRSTNGGDSWIAASNYNDVLIRSLAVADDGSIFAAARGSGIIKSTDRGATWNLIKSRFSFDYTYKIIYNTVTKHLFIRSVVYNPAAVSKIYRSTDLGANWEFADAGLPDMPIYELAFNTHTGQTFVATGGGLYKVRSYPK